MTDPAVPPPKPVKRNVEQDQQVADRIAAADLDTYMKQLRRLAKVALRKRPDLLKKLNG